MAKRLVQLTSAQLDRLAQQANERANEEARRSMKMLSTVLWLVLLACCGASAAVAVVVMRVVQ